MIESQNGRPAIRNLVQFQKKRNIMTEVIFRVDPSDPLDFEAPIDADSAQQRLLEGNGLFAEHFDQQQVVHVPPEAVGISTDGRTVPHQPFAAILGCSDARVPIELLFRCTSNSIFVVRVAGNVTGNECLGSLEYAVTNLGRSLKVIVVLGHSECGAVTAAVDSYLDPQSYPSLSSPIRTVIDKILPAVRMADDALESAYGGRGAIGPTGRKALIEISVRLNAALGATTINSTLSFPVRYGVFDLVSHEVDLSPPPANGEAMLALAAHLATSEDIRKILDS